MPRTLNRAPQYNLDVKTRVPIGQIQRTKEADLVPVSNSPLSDVPETVNFFKGLSDLGYNILNISNQNNESNRIKGWDTLVPDAQKDWNTLDTKSLDQLDELNLQLLDKYKERINTSDYNQKVKDLINSDLSNYSKNKMEQLYSKSIADNERTNINNFTLKYNQAVKEENLGKINRLIDEASNGVNAWMREDTSRVYRDRAGYDVYLEGATNDLAEMDYATAYDKITNQEQDGNGGYQYTEYKGLTGADRVVLEKNVAQAGALEAKRKNVAEYEASNKSLNALYSDQITIADFMKSNVPGLDMAAKTNVVNVYENQQKIEVARLDSLAAEPIRKGINDKTITDPDTIRAIHDPNLTETTRGILINKLEGNVRTVDPYKESVKNSAARLDAYIIAAASGDEPLDILRTALRDSHTTDPSTDLPYLSGKDYDKLVTNVQNKSALSKLTAILSGAQDDKRFIDKKTKLPIPGMYEEFARTYSKLYFDQINEQDPEKQMNIEQFVPLANKLIDTIADDKLQKEFEGISASNRNVGTGLLTSFRSNVIESAITSLNEGMYDAMKYLDPESWSRFERKMQDQYELIKGEPYNKKLELYKDKIPVFTNDKGEREMIIISGNIPQVVSLEAGLDKYKNLALGYNVGDKSQDGRTMLSTGWFPLSNKTVKHLGFTDSGEIIQPNGKDEYYLLTDTVRGTVVRPYHGNPNSKSEIAAAIKEVTNPIIEDNQDDEIFSQVRDSIRKNSVNGIYGYSPIPKETKNIPYTSLTPAQLAQEALKRGRQ